MMLKVDLVIVLWTISYSAIVVVDFFVFWFMEQILIVFDPLISAINLLAE